MNSNITKNISVAKKHTKLTEEDLKVTARNDF